MSKFFVDSFLKEHIVRYMKVSTSTALEESELQRLQRLADADDRTVSATLRMAILKGLPALEAEILGPQFAGKALQQPNAPSALQTA